MKAKAVKLIGELVKHGFIDKAKGAIDVLVSLEILNDQDEKNCYLNMGIDFHRVYCAHGCGKLQLKLELPKGTDATRHLSSSVCHECMKKKAEAPK
jgi:hypothetical protein